MQYYEMLALDLDGTLTNNRKEVTDRTKNAVLRMQQAGVQIVLASGRPMAGCWRVAKRLELDKNGGYILAFNGGQILECSRREMLFSKVIEAKLLPEIFQIARRFQVTGLTYEGDVVLAERVEDEYVQKECFINQITARQVNSLEEYVTWPVPKCMMVGEHRVLLPVKEYLSERFAGKLSVYFSEPFFLEIMADGVDKAYGMETLARYLGITRERIIACGDGLNDIGMIRYAGCGVAMANACAGAKEAADCQIPSNEQEGVAQLLEKLLKRNF